MSCCWRNGGSEVGLVQRVLIFFSFLSCLHFLFLLSVSFFFLLPFPGHQVGVVLQTVHVRQQHFCWLQRNHVLQVVVLVPVGEDVSISGVRMERNVG